MSALALRALEHHLVVYKRTWRGTVISSVVSPVLYLAAMGLGLGGLVSGQRVDGMDYVDFLAPGLLAATMMQTAVGDSTWPVMAAIKWSKSYHAMLATPLRVGDVLTGQLGWVAVHLTITAATFIAVATPFGVWHSALALLAVPAGVLTGLAFAAPVTALAAAVQNDSGFVLLYRLGIIPMFLFSATFFPISQLPPAFRVVAQFTPLWHGVTLCRGLAGGSAPPPATAVHVGYLALWVGVGYWLARRTFIRRLVT